MKLTITANQYGNKAPAPTFRIGVGRTKTIAKDTTRQYTTDDNGPSSSNHSIKPPTSLKKKNPKISHIEITTKEK